MPERLSDKIREYLAPCQGRRVYLRDIRDALGILKGTPDDTNLRVWMSTTGVKSKIVAPMGLNDGEYKVITQVKPVKVFGRERRPPIELFFPRDRGTEDQLCIGSDVVVREGDMILISGVSNQGKTALCLNFCGENIHHHPVLMGNEYTTVDGEPAPRFMSRMDNMDWVEWVNGTGEEKFTLLPVRADYAEHIEKDKINIIDWINLDAGSLYGISAVMENIKRELGRGIAIISLQKGEGAEAGRGGQFTKDFADLEILVDKYGEYGEILMRVGKVKEYKQPVTGRTFAYRLDHGVQIRDFREVVKCKACYGKGYRNGKPCDDCNTKCYVDKESKWTGEL